MGGMDRFYKRQKEREKEKQTTPSVSSASGGMDRYYKKQYYSTLDTSGVNDDYLKTFVSDANSFISGAGSNKLSYADANSKLSDLSSRYDTINAWLYKNKSNLDEKSYSSISTALGELKNGFDTIKNYYSQWESDEDYNKYLMGWLDTEATTDEKNSAQRKAQYQSNTERIDEIDKEMPFYAGSWVPNFVENLFLSDEQEATRNELEERKAENKQYERTQKPIDDYYIPVTDEFLKNASYRDYSNATREQLHDYDIAEWGILSTLENGGYYDENDNVRDKDGNIVLYANAPAVEDKLGYFLSAYEDGTYSEYTQEIMVANGNHDTRWADVMREGDLNAWAQLSEHEINIYYDLYKREGQESAYRYLDAMTTELTRRSTQKTTDYINNTEGLEQVFLNVASVPMSVFGGVIGFVDDTINVLQGEDINPYSRAHEFQNAATDIRAKTALDIDELTGNAAIPYIDFSVGDTYQALMSGADSLLGAAMGGTAYGVLMGMGAASSTAKDLYTKGATTEQIVAGSLLAGAAEMVFEKLSIDKLLESTDAKTIKDIVVNMLTQSGVEATEEMATEIATTITNYIVMGEQSDWVDMETFVKNVVNAGLGGFISGGGMAGIYSTAQKVVYDQQIKQYGQSIIDQGGVEDLQTTASNMTDNKTVARLVNKVAKNTSAKTVGRLAAAVQNVTDTNDKVSMVADLESKGLSRREATKVADFVTELSHGYEPSDNEIAEIEKITDKLPDVVDTAETATNRNFRTVEAEQTTGETAQTPTVAMQENTQQAEIVAETESIPTEENATETSTEAIESEAEPTVSIEEASKKYGAQAAAMASTYVEGQDVAKYDTAYRAAYDMGNSGVNLSYAMNSELTSYLTEHQRRLAYSAGADASNATAREQDAANKTKANGNTGRRKGTVKGDGVTISDIKSAVNDKQGTAYKLLSTYAEATGIDIVLFKSSANAKGEFEGSQGKFKWGENTIYIDINAGLANVNDVNELAKYTMLRTFAHEFTHFIEKWNPIQYNEFRKTVFDTLTERGEDVDELITTKMAQDGSGEMTYDEASREVIAEAMTDILPDANFVEELATKHKTIFNKLLEKLKEFVSELKAYFNSLLNNRSREANALKEQVGESVKYVESIVKLFDKVAVEAVENYQLTVATETETENTDGGIENAEQQTEAETDSEVRTDTTSAESNEGTLSKNGDGQRISEENGQIGQNDEQNLHLRGGQRGITQTRFPEDSFITPRAGSVEAEEYTKLAEYGIEGYVVKKSAWDRNVQAFARDGRIYMREEMDEIYRGTVVAHEATHIMKQLNYQPYLNFIDRTPDMLDMASDEAKRLMSRPAKHYDIDVFADEKQLTRIYDEINATVYGSYVAGQIAGEIKEFVDKAFYDFGAYINELSSIHEQFKKENAPKEEVKTHEEQAEVSAETSSEEIEKQYKEISRWLKRAKSMYVYILSYGENKYISDGSLAVKSNGTIIDRVKADFAGITKEADVPGPTVTALENATTLLTKAPLEGTLGSDSVYVFNLGGKTNHVFDKKKLSKLDGNLLYIGNYTGNFKIIKAVDANGDVVGFLLPMKVYTDITNTKPSKLKSFSNKILSQNTKQEVKPNVEETGTVLPHRSDGERDTRLLEEPQAEAVSGDGAERNVVDNSRKRRNEAGRDDNRTDAERTGGRSSERSSESADIRRDDGLTSEESTETAEKLHEEVEEQIAQQSTEQPKGRNFVIGESLELPNGEKARYKANVEAIRLVKQLEAESRYATEAEQVILSKYVGWGGLANAFDQRKTEWAKEYSELKELLTKEEYDSARGSTLNAHFTDISVIKAMYDGLSSLGFNGGRMLEPSSGVGNFVGAMPVAMTSKVKSWTMVELDGITGLIAKYLYPNADVRIQGFEKANIPDNYMDVAISNVPFGNYAITDKAYPKKVTSAIHNYFFAKSLDKVRPGGIVMFITSSYTMNSKEDTVRRYIMQRADLLGAIRLPDSAFKGNAGTEVVTDILILKKRAANTAYAGEDFLEAPYKYISGYNGAYINSYFERHPEMVLGTATMNGGMYRGNSLTYKALEGKGSLADQIREAFSHINGKMEYPATLSREKTNFAVERANKKTKENGLVVKDGKVYQNRNGELVEVNTAKGSAERISGMLEIRDAAKELMSYQQQGLNESEIKKARTKLNKVYDAFVKKYGYINAQANKNAIKDDPDKFSIFALENWNSESKKATKADIFSKNTVAPNRTVTTAKDVSEGLIVSVNQTGGVDPALIAKLTGKTEADVIRELIDSRQAFKNRNGDLEPAEVYLSGNVRAKLRDAEALVPLDKDYTNNVEALKSVVPEDVGYQDIFVNPGTPWIPNSVYSDFAAYMLGTRNSDWRKDVDITRNAETGNFTVELLGRHLKYNAMNTQKWGTPRRTFVELFDAMLNSKSVVIKDKLDDGSFVINKDATAAANEKIENIQKEFQEWLWKDEARRTELATLYNETFNSIVTPKYNGDNLTVNGANALKPLREHQRNAVQRVVSSGGNTLLAHRVGAGKTYEMAAAAMKLKELGLVKKPMFAVPKSLVAQWGVEFKDFFPTAKLLVAEAGDFTAANRKVFMNRIANGEYDAVIVSYEQFEKLPMSDDFTREMYEEEKEHIIRAIEEAKADKGGKALSVKDLEKKRKSLQTKIDKLTDKAKDEDNIDFEQLGVDSLFVDEAHNFKNLFYTTSMTNVSGLGNKDGSKRAFDLYTKVRYLQQLNGGRGIVFATATPVMNSMSEMYIMQKYLQPDLLNQLGLSTFDAWAKQFGEVVNGVEIKPSGQGYRVKQSFSRFKNMGELQLLFRNFADVLTDIPGLKIPKMKGGKVNVVVCESGEFQQNFMKELEKRADNIKNVDPSEDNMLKITSDGRKISYTQRMIDPTLPYEEGNKIFRCADNVIKEYNDSKSIKGTQLIFLDMATPKGKSDNNTETEDIEMDMENTQLYDDLKTRLRQGGIPAKEIAFIHDADTDQKKKKLFADVNDGKVRVLIGSTGKMGVGMNAQKRVVAIHHLDAPWRPGDVEQRDGRAFRQGNINEEVTKYTYVTEGSFDARLWDILDRKQTFINQIMNGESVGREAEDTGEVTLSAAEVKALASGSPLIMEQVQLDTDIKKLESLYRAHASSIRSAKDRLMRDHGKIAELERLIESGKADVAATVDTYSDNKFAITVGKAKYTDKKEAGVALMAEITAKAVDSGYTNVGSFAGFKLRVTKTKEGITGLLSGKQDYPFKTYPTNTTFMINHLIATVESISEKVKLWEHTIAETQADIVEQEKLIATPFAKQEELDKKRARYNEVMAILNPKEEQSLDSVDEGKTQEQSREYLNNNEQEQQRTTTLTDREVLAMAADKLAESKLSEAERDALQIFQSRLSRLEGLQIDRAEAGRLYKEQQFGANVNRTEAAQTLNRMHVLDEQIKTAEADVLSVENKKVFGEVLKKARKVVETEQRAHDAEIVKRWRDRMQNSAAIKKYRERIRTDVNELTNWVLKPNNKDIVKHIPDVLKDSVIPFLSSIDFTSKQQLRGGEATKADKEFVKRLNGLKSALKQNIDVNGLYSGYNDLPANFMEKLQTLIDAVQAITEKKSGEFVINQMSSEELKELSNVVRVVKAYITQINKFHANAMFQHVYEAGDSTIDSLSIMESDNGKSGTVSNFVFWQQIRPAFAFERFGSGGVAIYDGLRRGQAQLAFNAKEIVDFTKKAYTEAEVTAWEKEIKQINLGGDVVVKMPVSMIMSFYELSKQPDSLRHMLGEGFRVATYTNNGKKISDNGHTLTNENISTIINELTPRQKEVADALQKFMAEQGGAWGNYVSVKRFGEELFTNEQYFPINSDGRHLQATADEYPSAASLYALLNMSFTKSRNELANNRIIVYSIFDVFANHMSSMAQYNAMALPVLDAIKWFNYQQKTEDHDGNKYVKDGVREQMARVYGVSEETRPGAGNKGYAESFVLNILKAFNGTEAQGVPTDSVGMNALRSYNMAQIAFNFRVVVQQPLAITRAALLVDYGSVVKGMKLKPSAIKQNIEEMRKHSGIAAWKSLGFYDVNISRGLTETIKHSSDWKQKIGEIGMWSAEQADIITWAGIWSASKEEVKKKQKLTPNSDGFYEAVTKLFEDVIYKTQVVDSILTKNEYLRSKGLFARLTSSFMSEPTTTASMLIDTVDKYNADLKKGLTRQQAWEKNKHIIVRTMYVYGVSAVILAAVQAVADAIRDDDDYETFIEKWLEAFGGNLVDEVMPFNKLPLLSDFYDLAKELISLFGVDTYGNPPQSVFMQWYDSLIKGVEILYDRISGEDTSYTWYGGVYKLLQAASGMTGLPMASATREAITVWNNIVGAMAPSLKVKTYEPSEQNEIKYAYADGYLTFEEAVTELIEQGLVDNEDEAYFTVQGWEVGEGYSRYDALYNAVRNGTGVDTAINELTSHGYTESDIYSRIKSKTGEWYKNGEITKAQATSILDKYTDMERDDITEYVNKWSSVVVTGIEYDDIDEEFMAGNITETRAIEMYTRYGSMTQEKATEKVAVLSFVKEHPESEGISYAAVKAYTQYCEPYGIEVETFYDVWQYNSSISADVDESGKAISGSKKSKVLAYVNSLVLSARGKDSLYYALGYAESTIDEAPWR